MVSELVVCSVHGAYPGLGPDCVGALALSLPREEPDVQLLLWPHRFLGIVLT